MCTHNIKKRKGVGISQKKDRSLLLRGKKKGYFVKLSTGGENYLIYDTLKKL
jgi:hypothetical protein